MTRKQFTAQVEKIARAEYNAGGSVEINHGLPYVAVTCSNGEEYFFQGDEADDLLKEVPDYLNDEDYIMYQSTNW